MEKMEKLSMLSQPGVCELECVPVGGIDREKEFSDFWVMGVLLLRTRGLLLTYFLTMLFLCAVLSVSAHEHICTYCKNRLQQYPETQY